MDAKFIFKLSSLIASFTNCQAWAGKGGIACPFNGGNVPHPGKLPSLLFTVLILHLWKLMSACLNKMEQTIKSAPVKKRGSLSSSLLAEVGWMSWEQRSILFILQAWPSFKYKCKNRSVLPLLIKLESTQNLQTEISAAKTEVFLPSLINSN